jgi:predicted phosphodiesterase
MRYAVIADIHGNLPALEAVLRDAEEQGAESFILLGDYCNHLSQTREVLDLLAALPVSARVRGNEDEHTLRLRGQDQNSWTDGQFRTVYWTFRQLSQENFAYLETLPEEAEIEAARGGVLCFHKSSRYFPGTVLDALFCDDFSRRYAVSPLPREVYLEEYRLRAASDPVLCRQLAAVPHSAFLFAHSHMQYHFWVGGKLLLNPGSVGLHFDGHPGAPYTLLWWEDGWQVEERRVSYDHEETIRVLRTSPLYGEAAIWSEVIAGGLRHSREITYTFLEHIARYASEIGDTTRPYTKETWVAAYETWREKP